MKRLWTLAVLASAMLWQTNGAAGAFDLDGRCGSCHALTRPAETSLERIWSRRGPDLWYAGDKFNEDWLVAWLQNPKPIRPAGYSFFKTVKTGPDHDEPDLSQVQPHPALPKAEAVDAAQSLMQRKGPPDLVPKGGFSGDMSGVRLGSLAFNKLRGCSACHQGEGGKGGMSAPQLTNAGDRLQPDFIAAYITDPQRIDRYVWMPTIKLNEKDIQRLTGYLVGMKGEGQP